MHLERIAATDQVGPSLRSVIEINPDWEEIADRLDRERTEGNGRGPLHGVPVLVKDNIDTGDRIWQCGVTKVTIPRHREINELTAGAIFRALEDELGRGWWRR
jgi:Asp-tRNA(Asn)/Glu-tRNA(Gln) amidotransferase A subunit family amidase